jgi:hypothetical protein
MSRRLSVNSVTNPNGRRTIVPPQMGQRFPFGFWMEPMPGSSAGAALPRAVRANRAAALRRLKTGRLPRNARDCGPHKGPLADRADLGYLRER